MLAHDESVLDMLLKLHYMVYHSLGVMKNTVDNGKDINIYTYCNNATVKRNTRFQNVMAFARHSVFFFGTTV